MLDVLHRLLLMDFERSFMYLTRSFMIFPSLRCQAALRGHAVGQQGDLLRAVHRELLGAQDGDHRGGEVQLGDVHQLAL